MKHKRRYYVRLWKGTKASESGKVMCGVCAALKTRNHVDACAESPPPALLAMYVWHVDILVSVELVRI